MEIITHRFPPVSRGKDEILLMPVGDIQYAGDDKQIALGMLKRHIQWGVEHGAYFLGMGDYIDYMSPSNRQRQEGAAVYDTAKSVHDRAAEQLVQELYDKALKPSRGRWLGMLEGHHFHQFRAGMTSDMQLADKLQAKFLGTSAIIRLLFNRGGGGGTGAVKIWCHHGTGTGQTSAAILNKLKEMVVGFDADIFLMGHLPKKANDPIDRLETVFPRRGQPFLVHRTILTAGTGGFMKSWIVGNRQGIVPRGGYGEQGMMRPAALGGILVRIRPRWKLDNGHDYWSPDMSVEA